VVFDADTAALTVDGLLRPPGTRERAGQEKRYLKSDLEFIGVTVLIRDAQDRGAQDRDGVTLAFSTGTWQALVSGLR
jgi:hypothetical protein